MKRRSSATNINERCASPIIKRTKVQAQRKFAQGSNNYVNTPTKVPPKPDDEINNVADNDDRELNNFSNLPTIDDFLTFLCYRETEVLPQRLNYLNTPQFETIPAKKKTLKSNPTSLSSLSSSKSSIDHDKASDKINSHFKNKKKVPEFPIRSNKEIKCKPIISKTSRSLALKHNQRLRKTVQSKFTENKLPNFKTKTALNKLSATKNPVEVEVNKVKNHSITRAASAIKETPKKVEPEVKRVTRRNSNLNALVNTPDIVKSPVKRSQTRSCSTSVVKELSKPFMIPIPRVTTIINTNTSPVKTRSTRSATARAESNLKTPSPSTSSRPTRKTKEAAALYMETLGKDLLRGDESFDEDDLLIEDYFELSNIEPAKPKQGVKALSKKPKAIASVKRKLQNNKITDNKSTTKAPDKIHKPIKKVIKKDRAQIEKLNSELKKIVDDKPLKEKLECGTKKIDIDKELETIDQILSAAKDKKVNDSSDSIDESTKNGNDLSREDSLELIQNILISDDESESLNVSKVYDSIENIDIPDFIVGSKDEQESDKSNTPQTNNSTAAKIRNNVRKDKISVQSIENIVLGKDEHIDDDIQQKERNTSNANTKNCMKKLSEKIELEISNDTKKNCLKKLEEKTDKSEVPKLLSKTCCKKPSDKIENAVLISTTKNHLKKSIEKIDKLQATEKKSSEKVEKSVVVLKKSTEKIEKSDAVTNKPTDKVEKLDAVVKKAAEKMEKSDAPIKKWTDKEEKSNLSTTTKHAVKKLAENLEKPEVPFKKAPEKIIKLEVPSKKAVGKIEKPEVLNTSTKNCLKKPAEKVEKPTTIPKSIVPVFKDKKSEKQLLTTDENPSVEISNKSKNIEKPKRDINSTIGENKISKIISPTEETITKKILNRKKPSVKIIRAKTTKSEEDKQTVNEIGASKITKIEEAKAETVTKKELVIDESKKVSSETKPMPKLVFANGKSTMTQECSQKPMIQTIDASNNKIFCLESKKIIFKKNKAPTITEDKEEISSRKTEAFSADNENSVYAFEPDLPTTSPPFRRLKPVTPPKSLISGNSIAVQVNFDSSTKIECSSSSETQVSSTTDCEDRVFYIPIQTSDTSSTLGVAVKLDTDGANQKIIMSATLVTKSPSFTTSTATTVASKSVRSESSTSEVVDQIEMPKKPLSKENADKVVATADSQSSARTSTDSPSSTVVSPKPNKKVSSTTKPNQSVKIVKINKVKKSIPPKPKPKPVKAKSTKSKPAETDKPVNSSSSSEILQAPTFYPSEAEFNDPLKYIDSIKSVAEKFGLCRIVPPSTFRPECKVADEMRFTAYNQYVHKMLHRWGPNVKEMMAIRKFLATQNIQLTHAPWIGGMEVDLPRLYQIVQQCGGLKAVIEKERWHQVADVMKIPKLAQDRITKLDDIYCKYLLAYDILSHNEREKLFDEVEKDWNTHLENPSDEEDAFDDVDECIVKGRTMPLSCFYRIARNTMMMCFGSTEGQAGPSTETIETEFWNHVSQRKSHICVHSGSIDTGVHGYGFSIAKNSTFRKHPWNLKVLTNNSASILRSLGPIMGVTVPTLYVGMLYSACCWYRDPHGLPWIEYLHTGANKIWYGIPDEYSDQFSEAMRNLVPRNCRDKKVWLPSDTVMIPPPLLAAQNVPLSRVVQQPGQFIVVFPKAFTSCISTGYMVSESVYFATASWLNSAKQIFSDMQESCEPSVFSLEQLLISVATDVRASLVILAKILPLLIELRDSEVMLRSQLTKLGLNNSEKMQINKKRKTKASFSDEDNYECEICRANLFVSLIINSLEQTNYCLKHATNLLQKKPSQVKYCKLMYAYTEEELEGIIKKVQEKIETKGNRKPSVK